MNRDQVINALKAIGIDYNRYPRAALEAFVGQMATRVYSSEQTAAAFLAFVDGWKADDGS